LKIPSKSDKYFGLGALTGRTKWYRLRVEGVDSRDEALAYVPASSSKALKEALLMVRALLLLGALIANTVLFAATWTKGSTATDDKSTNWWPCPEAWCPWDEC
jgi:hypothetical protein